MRVIIVEDNHMQRRILHDILKKQYAYYDITVCEDIHNFTRIVKNEDFDIYLLDVEVSDKNSIEYMEHILDFKPEISQKTIYISGYKKYAMDAMNRTHCFGYIEKPYDEPTLINKIESCIAHNKKIDKPVSYFDFRIKGETNFISKADIYYIEYLSKKPIIHTKNNLIPLPRTTVTQLLTKLNDDCDHFIRCRRDNIVNINYISGTVKENSLNYVLLTNSEKVQIGNKFKEDLFDRLRI